MLHGEPLMDDASLKDFNKGEGTYVANTLERSLLLPADMENLKNLRRARAFPQYEEVPQHGKVFNICGFSGLCSFASNLHLACF